MSDEAKKLCVFPDVSHRKYLEHVADKITTWTKEEELKREERQIKNQSSAGTPNGTLLVLEQSEWMNNLCCVHFKFV